MSLPLFCKTFSLSSPASVSDVIYEALFQPYSHLLPAIEVSGGASLIASLTDAQPHQIPISSKPRSIRAWRTTEPVVDDKGRRRYLALQRLEYAEHLPDSNRQDLGLIPGMCAGQGWDGPGQGRRRRRGRFPRPLSVRASSTGRLQGSAVLRRSPQRHLWVWGRVESRAKK